MNSVFVESVGINTDSLTPSSELGVSASLLLFGFLIDRAGFVPALVVLIFGAAASGTEFRFVEVLLLTAVLTVFSVALFVWGIGLPYPLFVGF